MAYSSRNFISFGTVGAQMWSSQVEMHYKIVGAVSPQVLHYLDKVKTTPGQPFVIGDYGTADGGTSYSLMQKVIAQLRKKHGTEMPIQVVYEDQPVNDFKPAFLRAHGLIPGTPSLTTTSPNVFVLASGCSFYTQCMPANSMDFIVSFCAVIMLSKIPDAPPSSLFPFTTKGPAHDAFKKQSEEDWETFLLLRAKELKSGGFLVLTSICDCNEVSAENMITLTSRLWRDMFVDGPITKIEFERAQFNYDCRSQEEVEKPFKDENSSVLMSGLTLLSIEPVYVARDFTGPIEDLAVVREYARSISNELRAWQEGVLLGGLSDNRSTAEKQAIIDTFYQRCFELLLDDPLKYNIDYKLHLVVIRKD